MNADTLVNCNKNVLLDICIWSWEQYGTAQWKLLLLTMLSVYLSTRQSWRDVLDKVISFPQSIKCLNVSCHRAPTHLMAKQNIP